MQRITCTRRLQFCAGHRVMGHENKCAHPHGHNYVVFLTAEYQPGGDENLDDLGRVVDFSCLKEVFGTWIDENWDHGFIYHHADTAMRLAMDAFYGQRRQEENPFSTPLSLDSPKVFRLPYNPTAENMAKFLLGPVATAKFNTERLRLVQVRVDETENCSAFASVDFQDAEWRQDPK